MNKETIKAAFNKLGNLNENFKILTNVEVASVKEVKYSDASVIIITVPFKQINSVRGLSALLIPELEKELGSVQVCIVGQHRAFPKTPEPNRRYKAIRNAGRTLRHCREAILEDLVFPTAIVGKRIHYNLEGKQSVRVILDKSDSSRVEDRLKGFAAAYNRLTGLNTVFTIADH